MHVNYNTVLHVQAARDGQSANLAVLKDAGCLIRGFNFIWSKVGDHLPPPVHPRRANIVAISSVSEEDFGHYKCEVKKAGTTVLTVYKALYKDKGWYYIYITL